MKKLDTIVYCIAGWQVGSWIGDIIISIIK